MIHGVGVDLVSLERFDDFARRHAPRLPDMFTATERRGARSRERLAECFAVKEAVLKALGGLIGWELDWREIAWERGAVVLRGSVEAHAASLAIGTVRASATRLPGHVLATATVERLSERAPAARASAELPRRPAAETAR